MDKEQKDKLQTNIAAGELKPNTEKSSKKQLWQFVLIGLVFFGLGFIFNAAGAKVQIGPNSNAATPINLSKMWQVNDILKQKFDGDINKDKQATGAVAGMVASLGDPYTVYLDAKQNRELSEDLAGELSGIGIEVGIKNGHLSVIAPIDSTPAAKAGLRAGDIIATIDGVGTDNITTDEAVKKIRGDEGTTVKLGIVRAGAEPKEYIITREKIKIESVKSEMMTDGIGYIKIRRFGDDTYNAVVEANKKLKEQGARGIIIDVRDNPGGYLDGAIKVSSQYVSEGVIVEERSRTMKDKKFNAIAGGIMTNIPVVMLINGGSASASEIMAGALHDNKRATLVGDKTYGKGSVQEVVCLGGLSISSGPCKEDSLKVTVAHWFTPNGVNISKEGIRPDVEVKYTNEDYNQNKDPQLQKALETIKQKL